MRSGIYIKTDRLIIREIQEGDIDDFHEIVTHPGFYYYCFDGTPEKTQAFITDAITSRTKDPRLSFMMAVSLHSAPNKVIGHVTLDYLPKNPDLLDLAYFVHPQQQRQGIATEAAKAMTEYAGSALESDEIIATAHPDNIESQRVLEHIGFRYIGQTSVESTNGDNQRYLYQKAIPQGPKKPQLAFKMG